MSVDPGPYRPQFIAALTLLARMSEEMAASGYPRPVLVGGAAVEYYTASAISTGDFDLCTPWQEEFEAIMQRHGFIRPSGPGVATRGWIHPELALGFEIVASVPMDGSVDPEHLVRVEGITPGQPLTIISVEDLIADRMGQYASGTAPDRIDQARMLLRLNPQADVVYLDRRIREESIGDHGIDDVRRR